MLDIGLNFVRPDLTNLKQIFGIQGEIPVKPSRTSISVRSSAKALLFLDMFHQIALLD